MFDQNQKATALLFAQKLVARDYRAALELCSRELKLDMNEKSLGKEFEAIVPLDWGEVDSVVLEENCDFPFIFITLGGDVFSEAIIIHSFATENGQTRIAGFEFGRP
jgi:hypothetical protein